MGNPTYMYRRNEAGGIDAKIFDSDELPEGWQDHPGKCTEPEPWIERSEGEGNDATAEKPKRKAK